MGRDFVHGESARRREKRDVCRTDVDGNERKNRQNVRPVAADGLGGVVGKFRLITHNKCAVKLKAAQFTLTSLHLSDLTEHSTERHRLQ